MTTNKPRIGNFTSSEISALMCNGKGKGTLGRPALTYIAEKQMERRLGRSVSNEINSRPLTWGQLIEKKVFEYLGLEYELVSTETITHPKYPFWAGSPDANKFDEGKTVVDIKSPMTLKSFCTMVDPLYKGLSGWETMQIIRKEHKEGESYYWQLVSNSILTNSKFAELIVYAPYLSELTEIRKFAEEFDIGNEYKYYWIGNAIDEELPYLLDGGYYKNINIIRFEAPQEDKDLLTERVLLASKLLDN